MAPMVAKEEYISNNDFPRLPHLNDFTVTNLFFANRCIVTTGPMEWQMNYPHIRNIVDASIK